MLAHIIPMAGISDKPRSGESPRRRTVRSPGIVIDREERGSESDARTGWAAYPGFSAALLVLSSAVCGADYPKEQEPSEVVMKSLETNLLVDGRVVDTKGEFRRYRVEQAKGDWLWLVADCGTRGWCHRRDVIPADQAIAFFSAAIAREPQSVRAYRMRGLAHYDALEYRSAIRDASAAIRLEPNFAPAYVDRCYAKLEKPDIRGRDERR